MTRIVWLASYPKSGNTWVRLFLARLLYPDTPWSLDELVRRIPHPATHGSPVAAVMKTHDVYTPELFPTESVRAAVYLLRDPRDVVLSLAAHGGWSQEYAASVLQAPGATLADPRQRRQHIGSWASHVRSWSRAPFRVLRVRYEDLLADPFTWFRRIAELVAPGTPDAAVVRAMDAVRFDRLQAAERATGFVEASPYGAFFRVGRAGQWRDALAPGLVDAIERTCGAVMACGGYAADCRGAATEAANAPDQTGELPGVRRASDAAPDAAHRDGSQFVA